MGNILPYDGIVHDREIVVRPHQLPRWYRLEWAEHTHREWDEVEADAMGLSFRFCTSARLEPRACVEGHDFEFDALAKAVLAGQETAFKRCAVVPTDLGVGFLSPNNSGDRVAFVTHARARAWAEGWLAGRG